MTLHDSAEIVGKTVELAGILLTGSEIFMIRARQVPWVLIQALFRGNGLRDALVAMRLVRSRSDAPDTDDDREIDERFNENREIATLQGIAFVVLGILIQMWPSLWAATLPLRQLL
jgi:hypothetical protein